MEGEGLGTKKKVFFTSFSFEWGGGGGGRRIEIKCTCGPPRIPHRIKKQQHS